MAVCLEKNIAMETILERMSRRWEMSKPALRSAAPYLVLALATMVAFYFWIFYAGIAGGDDVEEHLIMVTDLIDGFNNGFFESTGHNIFGNLAYNPYLYYGHFAQYIGAGFGFLFQWAGAGPVEGIKFVSVTSVFVSGIYAYYLGRAMTKSDLLGLAFGIAYIFMPYRLFCFYYRFALSEAVAWAFLPILFYGLYTIINEEKARARGYIAIVIGGSGLILCHPFTALICGFSGLVYLLFNIKKTIRLFLDKSKAIHLGIAAVLLVFMVVGYVYNLLEGTMSDYYVFNDDEAMWTTLESVIWRIGQSAQFSGFINFQWLLTVTPMYGTDTVFYWALGLALFPTLCLLAYLIDWAFVKYGNNDKWMLLARILFIAMFLFVPLYLANSRLEVCLGMVIFYASFLYFRILYPMLVPEKPEELPLRDRLKKDWLKNPELYFYSLGIIVGFLYIFTAWIWEISPSILYMGQFPYRFWGLVYFFIFCFLLYLVVPFRKNRIALTCTFMVASMMMVVGQGQIDKRIFNYEPNNYILSNPDHEYFKEYTYWGTSDEYMPQVLLDIGYGSEAPSYHNSLASQIGNQVVTRFSLDPIDFGLEDYITPVFLEGEGSVEVFYVKTPEASFNISVASEDGALFQIPQIYYPGYSFHAVYEDGHSIDCEVTSVDGLVAAYIPAGDYVLHVTYPGTMASQASHYLFPIAIVGLVGLGAYDWWAVRGSKKEEKIS